MKARHLLISALVSAVLCMPAGGFVFGFVHCVDCGWNLAMRAFIGLLFAVLSPIFLGFPPKNEGGVGEPYNAWPYIGTTAAAIFIVVTAWIYVRKRDAD